jgi:hypothetical protein
MSKDTEKSAPEVKYSIGTLSKNCKKLFGVSQSTFAGATFGLTGEFTVEDMDGKIKEWLKKEVK